MSFAEKNYYAILGVKPTASSSEIKKAFRKLARMVHPDVLSSDSVEAGDRFTEIKQAYDFLYEPRKLEEELQRQLQRTAADGYQAFLRAAHVLENRNHPNAA